MPIRMLTPRKKREKKKGKSRSVRYARGKLDFRGYTLNPLSLRGERSEGGAAGGARGYEKLMLGLYAPLILPFYP